VDIQAAVTMPDGCKLWLDWHQAIAPDNVAEVQALEADRGQTLGYVRLVGRRREDAKLEEQILCVPAEYTREPLLRGSE
jgi:hypothetical protein